MSNTFASNLMPRILGGALEVLREECIAAEKVTKDYAGAAGQLGDTVSVSVPYAQTTYDITPAAVAPALTDTKMYSKTITISNWKGTRFNFTSKEVTEYNFSNSAFIPRQIGEAARTIARAVNQSIMALYTKIPGWAGLVSGRAFATANKLNYLGKLDSRLNYQLCPDNERVLILGLNDTADAKVLDEVIKNPQLAGDAEAYRRGRLGKILDFEMYRDRDVPTHTAGAGATGAVTVNAGTAAGATSVVVNTAASTGALVLAVGDVVTFSVDTQKWYSVQTAVNVGAGTTATIDLDRPLESTLTTSHVMTIPTGFGTGTHNIAGELSGFGLVMRVPPSSIEGAPEVGPSMVMVDPKTGIPLKLSYLPGYHAAQFELSALWGVDVVDQRRLCRFLSQT